ncbi:substrate-binding domain-containing protein [Microbacterium sp.]|uniref:substrate-binding domain-containing protein n=1 Tax=Microbacterium sp. TaxID=51671 RepID=UPI003F9A87B7
MLASRATLVVAFNDLRAIGLILELQRLGVSVPDELSVCGNDDVFGADFMMPALTTIRPPLERLGELGVTMAIRMLDAQAPEEHASTMTAEFIERRSLWRAPA